MKNLLESQNYYNTYWQASGIPPIQPLVKRVYIPVKRYYVPKNIQANLNTLPPQMREFVMQFNRELEQQAKGNSKNNQLIKTGAVKAYKKKRATKTEDTGKVEITDLPENVAFARQNMMPISELGDLNSEQAIIEVIPESLKRFMVVDNSNGLFRAL